MKGALREFRQLTQMVFELASIRKNRVSRFWMFLTRAVPGPSIRNTMTEVYAMTAKSFG